ncbi:MAG TPA: hypothetical protein VF272_02900 [Candidatus Saccharimonadia bacterium]
MRAATLAVLAAVVLLVPGSANASVAKTAGSAVGSATLSYDIPAPVTMVHGKVTRTYNSRHCRPLAVRIWFERKVAGGTWQRFDPEHVTKSARGNTSRISAWITDFPPSLGTLYSINSVSPVVCPGKLRTLRMRLVIEGLTNSVAPSGSPQGMFGS